MGRYLMIETRGRGMLNGTGERSFGNTDGHGGASDLEPGKNNFEHGFESAAFFGEAQ